MPNRSPESTVIMGVENSPDAFMGKMILGGSRLKMARLPAGKAGIVRANEVLYVAWVAELAS